MDMDSIDDLRGKLVFGSAVLAWLALIVAVVAGYSGISNASGLSDSTIIRITEISINLAAGLGLGGAMISILFYINRYRSRLFFIGSAMHFLLIGLAIVAIVMVSNRSATLGGVGG